MRTVARTLLTICSVSVLVLICTGRPLIAQETYSQPVAEEVRADSLEMLRNENEALKKELEGLRQLLKELKQQQLKEKPHQKPEEAEAFSQQKEKETKAEEALQKALEQLQAQMEQLEVQKQKAMQDYADAIKKKEKSLEDLSVEMKKTQDEVFQRQQVMADAYAGFIRDMASKRAEGPYQAAENAERTARDLARLYSLGSRERELEDAMLSHGNAGLATMLRFEKVKVYRKLNMYDRAADELRGIVARNLNETVTNAARWTLVEVLQEQEKQQAALAELEQILNTTQDAQKKKDAIYGIINLLRDDPQSKLRTIERLIHTLEGRGPGISPGVPGVVPVAPPGVEAVPPTTELPALPQPAISPSVPAVAPPRSTPGPRVGISPRPSPTREVAPTPPGASEPAPSALPTPPEPAPDAPALLPPSAAPPAPPGSPVMP
jgi:ElaB/YqjD/DUF883 family membrane-anchored ribosome-binding protein